MEIIRIPASYYSQLEYLPDKDFTYVMRTIFKLCNSQDIKVEKSLRGGLVISMYREITQMENKTRAKKGQKRLNVDLATLMAYTDAPNVGSQSCEKVQPSNIKSNQVTSNQIKENNNILSKDNIEINSYEENGVEKFGNKEINNMQDFIKKQVKSLGYIYKAGKYERQRIKNILQVKTIQEILEKHNMEIYDFVGNIIMLSGKLDFWNGKITNAETFYKHYDKILNESLKLKQEKEKNKPLII